MARQLFGSLGDLQRTAAFVRGTGVSIGVIDKKKKIDGWLLTRSQSRRSYQGDRRRRRRRRRRRKNKNKKNKKKQEQEETRTRKTRREKIRVGAKMSPTQYTNHFMSNSRKVPSLLARYLGPANVWTWLGILLGRHDTVLQHCINQDRQALMNYESTKATR